VRVWIDITNSPHVPFFRPLIRLLRQDGHDVEVTARAFAQTVDLLDLHGIDATIVGTHGGRSRLGKTRVMASRLRELHRWARRVQPDAAIAHGSHDLTITARRLRVPSTTTFDYEYALAQHQLGARAATRVVVPAAIPSARLTRYGLRPPKLVRYPGLKEEYYLADFEPDSGVPASVGVDPDRILVVLRPPPDVALYHRTGNPLFPRTLAALGRRPDVHAVVLPRTPAQREHVDSLALPSVILPERAVDAQSLIAAADLVISAGGTMNREAVALGVPVYTVFGGRLGGVDESLIRDGRLRVLTGPETITLGRRGKSMPDRIRRDPRLLLDLLLPQISTST
jgi:predicted glycosyltransferase